MATLLCCLLGCYRCIFQTEIECRRLIAKLKGVLQFVELWSWWLMQLVLPFVLKKSFIAD